MIKIAQEENLWDSEACQACMSGYGFYNALECDSCSNHVMTSYRCPCCYATQTFRADRAPVICETCQAILLDIRLLLRSQEDRIDYHLSPEVIDVQPEAIDVQSY